MKVNPAKDANDHYELLICDDCDVAKRHDEPFDYFMFIENHDAEKALARLTECDEAWATFVEGTGWNKDEVIAQHVSCRDNEFSTAPCEICGNALAGNRRFFLVTNIFSTLSFKQYETEENENDG